MKQMRLAAAAAATILTTTTFAHATVITQQGFDSDPTLSETQAAGSWYVDRYAPAGFSSEEFMGDKRLAHEITAADGADNRPSSFSSTFYNTQGRKYDTGGADRISIDLYFDAAFETGGRLGGFWGTAFDAADAIAAYPIIDYFGTGTGKAAGFRYWDGAAFVFAGTPSGFAWDAFNTLTIELDRAAEQFEYLVNGEAIGASGANGATRIGNVILQNYNSQAGTDRTLYWDDFSAEVTAPIPLPATLPMLLAGLGLAGVVARRKRG